MYNEDSIEVLSLREAIQHRPRMYLGREKFDIDALYTLISWLVEGAVSKKGVNHADHIDIVLERDNWVTISDNGIGIDEENLSRIFDMFYRATEQSDGSGIGLYIVKNAVDKLGGQINVASKPGHGTRFNLLLPNRINSILHTTPLVVA